MDLAEAFRRQVAGLALPPGRALVAVSGGPDSVALLALLVETRDVHHQDLIVAHVDHGIHPDGEQVAEQVRALAASYRLPVHVGRLRLGPGANETTARAERYAFLSTLRATLGAGVVFTGHHADDQVETVLMRVLAGSGPAGLSGMAAVRGDIVRPLLQFSRAELVLHLEKAGLRAWLDPANSDSRHLRSWVRTELLPALRHRLPEVDAHLLRTSRQASRDRAAWDAVLDALPELDSRVEHDGISVAASSLAGYDSALSQALVIAAARRVGCQLGPGRTGRIFSLLKGATSGAQVPLGGTWRAELAFGRLRICSELSAPVEATWQIEPPSGEGKWGRWRFHWTAEIAPETQKRAAMSAWFPLKPLTVRSWSPGEKLKPLGGTGRRLAVRCFQEGQVPRSHRKQWPVVAHDEGIAWIPGVCRSDIQLPLPGSEALRVDAEYA